MSLFRIIRRLQPRLSPSVPDGTQLPEPITQDMLVGFEGLVVILGPAGSGKSVLLEDLARAAGAEIERAAFFVDDPELAGSAPLFIDGCDEVGLAVERRPVGEVQKALKKLSYPTATITCRGIDWNDGSDPEQFKRAYGEYPYVVDLLPFTRKDALRSMTGGDSGNGPLDQANAESLLRRLDEQNLSDFYTNPLNLEIIVKIGAGGGREALPATRSELFAKAGRLLCEEHRGEGRSGSPLNKIGEAEAHDAVGLLCLASVLSGQGVIARDRGQGGEHTPSIPDLEIIAGAESLRAVLQSRLFRPDGGEGLLMPVHKMVGDYLAAQWLIRCADGNQRLVRRIVRSLAPQGLPSTDRRALWAWLAVDPAFTPLIVETDPVSVLHYGDPDGLSDDNMVALLDAMARRLSEAPGRFFDDHNQIPEFTVGRERPKTRVWLESVIFDVNAERGTRVFALDLIKSCPHTINDIKARLLTILRDPNGDLALRPRSVSICKRACADEDWEAIVRALLLECSGDAARMACSIMRSPAVANLPHDLRAEIFLAVAGAQPEQTESHPNLVAKTFYIFNEIPTDELSALLEAISAHPWWEEAKQDYPRGRVGHELSRPIRDTLLRLAEAALLTPRQLATWWSIAADADYGGDSLATQLAKAWNNAKFRQATALHILTFGTEADGYREKRHVWLAERLREEELSGDDITAILEEFAAIIDFSCLSHTVRNSFARFAYNGESEKTAEILDSAMARKRGLERWTRKGWEEWATPTKEVPEWQTKRDERTARHHANQDETQKNFIEDLGDAQKRRGAARTLADVYLGWQRFNNVPDFDNSQEFRDYLGEEGFAHFLAECEAILPDAKAFSVDAILACESGKYLLDIQLAMIAIWQRYQTGKFFDDLTEDARATAWMASIFSYYGPFSTISEMKERQNLQTAVGCKPEAVRAIRQRFLEMTYNEFDARHGILEGVIPDAGGDKLAFDTGLAWLLSAPERLSDRFSSLLTALRSVDLSEAVIDNGLSDVAADLLKGRTDLSERATSTLEAILFLHHPHSLIPKNAGEPFLQAIRNQLTYCMPERAGFDRELTLKPTAASDLFQALRSNIALNHDIDRFMHPEHGSSIMKGLLKQLREDASDEAKLAITAIPLKSDSWTEELRDAVARQHEAWARHHFDPLGPKDIAFIVDNSIPQTADQMHAAGLEALEVLQARIKSSSEDLATPYAQLLKLKGVQRENALNAHTVSLLTLPQGVRANPEILMRKSTRTDIALLTDARLLPIEAKGQWNGGLYLAAMDQLDEKYATHWQAEGRGIYLVYWLGADQSENRNKVCKPTGEPRPATPKNLKTRIEAALPQEMRDRISIVVLDITGD